MTGRSKGWVARWKTSGNVMLGFFRTRTDAVANAIFNDIDEDVEFEEMTFAQYKKAMR